jgi:hypothetical protein
LRTAPSLIRISVSVFTVRVPPSAHTRPSALGLVPEIVPALAATILGGGDDAA